MSTVVTVLTVLLRAGPCTSVESSEVGITVSRKIGGRQDDLPVVVVECQLGRVSGDLQGVCPRDDTRAEVGRVTPEATTSILARFGVSLA